MRLKLLDSYSNTLDRKRGVVIEQSIETYKQERSKVHEDYMAGLRRQRELSETIDDAVDEVNRLTLMDTRERRKAAKEKANARKAKDKDKFRRTRRREERTKERQRIRKERERFWPKYCYSVRITLETDAPTPLSSRRTSVSSEKGDVIRFAGSEEGNGEAAATVCDLSLSYVTTSAYWAPSYDLQLSTTSASGALSFDAELHNSTSETWTNCKVILSTSQATFSGLDDAIPTLTPWYLSLQHGDPAFGHQQTHEHILRSAEEAFQSNVVSSKNVSSSAKSRTDMFGLSNDVQGISAFLAKEKSAREQKKKMAKSYDASSASMNVSKPFRSSLARSGGQSQQQSSAGGFGQAASSSGSFVGGLFGRSQAAPPPPPAPTTAPMTSSLFGSAAPSGAAPRSAGVYMSADARRRAPEPSREEEVYSDAEDEASEDGAVDAAYDPDYADSTMEQTGLTTTHELPGVKTLVPKTTATKQRVARVRFTNIEYSHTVVAKLRPVAYLKAKMTNASKMTLFKGRAGLTLDGSFLGRMDFPRCSAGESVTLSLGVDPAIKVKYPKPTVQRASTGLFRQDNTAVFTRSVTLHNTRATGTSKATTLVVLDQVPVSQDDKLRIEILTPDGLTVGRGNIRAGKPGLEAKNNANWGSARASLKENGEVTWDVTLNAGKAVCLNLEYGLAFPSGYYPS